MFSVIRYVRRQVFASLLRQFGTPGKIFIPLAGARAHPCYSPPLGTEPFSLKSRYGVRWLECAPLTLESGIVHAFSTRHEPGQVSGASQVQLLPGQRHRLLAALDAEEFQPAHLRQIHSANVVRVSKSESGEDLQFRVLDADEEHPSHTGLEGDALLTDEPGVLLEVRAADCMPILIADQRLRAIAAVHAGWRGALARIIEKAVSEMQRQFESRAEELLVAIGPSIRACCYEVGKEVVEAFADKFPDGQRFFKSTPGKSPNGNLHLDLVEVARAQLHSAGVDTLKIFVADYCTASRTDLFYSFRKEGDRAGRMMAVIGMRPSRQD